MTSDHSSTEAGPLYEAETDTAYSIEVITELTGMDAQTIIRYQEQGFIRPASGQAADSALFDAESLRQLRRIEHLRSTCAVNDTGLKLILDLLHEIECLRQERRQSVR
ncbi:MerR family transcriptional regulator/heat shock protein HspR [Prosthecobacter fusiformis]|uniref:MerR family transcriptional regulator/heat shock protein HspR n=1 Tax=Prosthecobacter fusiformis TaxID=48464 RepID=A0A4R7SPZ6_9BACT|nr:chaperone modulator CbpM [Prosthecobacter fusiformis]TDU81300.1 MerR family transcriptional regulator/heat shock protein HspR [Prosthecobacter fusiformis]